MAHRNPGMAGVLALLWTTLLSPGPADAQELGRRSVCISDQVLLGVTSDLIIIHHLPQSVVERTQVGIDFRPQIAW